MEFKEVTSREALTDLSKFLREVYVWCDVNGEYKGTVSLSQGTVKGMRRLVDAVLEADASGGKIRLMEGYDSVYAQLMDRGGR